MSAAAFRTVLFDLDGTLLDHFQAIHRAYCHTLPQLGLPAPTRDQVRRAVGGGLENAMLHFVTPDRLAEALAIYRPFWDQTHLEGVELLPGAHDLLAGLHARGVTCAVLTNKVGHSSRALCDHLGLAPCLSGVWGAKDTPWLKPQREFTQHALTALGGEFATTLLIGDSPFDVQAGLEGGFPVWAVTTGTHDAAELRAAGAARVADSLEEFAAELAG